MDLFIELLKEVNIAQIVIIFFGVWFFYHRVDKKIDSVKQDLGTKIDAVDLKLNVRMDKFDTRMDKLETKIDDVERRLTTKIEEVDRRLGAKIDDVDRRLCRIEGSLATQGHCMFNQPVPAKKVE